MNREERYTTVTLTINGESAKRTLEELSRKAEELGERLRLIRGRGTGDEEREVSPGNEGRGTGNENSAVGAVRDTAAEVRRLEGELARVLGEIEAIESGAESVEGVMGRIARQAEEKKGLSFFGGKYHFPDWFMKKHKGSEVNVGGMTLAEAAELYRILSGIKSEVIGLNGYGVREGAAWQPSGNEGRGTGDERALSGELS